MTSDINTVSVGGNASDNKIIAGDNNIIGDHNIVIHGGEKQDWEKFYLNWLIEHCDRLDITAIDETCSGEAQKIRVSDVFTTLYLKDILRMPDQPVRDAILKLGSQKDGMNRDEKKEQIPIKATEAVAHLKCVVILGGPGSGKSTLVNHIAAIVANKRLKHGDSKPLPVMIILRKFAAWIPKECKKGTQGLIWEYLKKLLQEIGCGEDFLSSLKLEMNEKVGVIFFDGLDEVRESDEDKRSLILDAIQDFAVSFRKCRIVITCREYAYRPPNKASENTVWRLPESQFPVVQLDVFRSEQIQKFISTWYMLTGKSNWDEKADNLYQTVEDQPHLKSLAESPLLLTLMAQVHGRDGELPEYRADLYKRAVNLLLADWEIRIDQETCRSKSGNVPNVDTMRSALERVALSAHEKQEKEKGDRTQCADISREDLREQLASGLGNSLDKAEKVIGYIQNRAGLLQEHGKRIFKFPHRTFQEFLAGTGILKRSDWNEFLQARISRDLPWWQEVFLLAAGSCRDQPTMIYYLINELLLNDPDDKTAITSEIAKFAGLAARAMGETDFSEHVQLEQKSKRGKFSIIHERVQKWLKIAMTADKVLTPEERCDAGNALNWVGDPRFDPERWYLPKDDDGFIEIPAGSFMMGSDKKRDKDALDREFPPHSVELSAYSINRYPVTVAQFRVFVQETGYDAGSKWSSDPDNHPVRYVSWDDAVKYCEWLTEKLEMRIQLPTEAQWEYAARGTDGRIYPWGDEADPDKANYDDTGINTTSPVGCFPSGNRPCGISDMAGNVWEWCQDWYGEYTADAVTNPIGAGVGSDRVLRGGSWYNFARHCRAALRNYRSPGRRYNSCGFRLVRP